jgi:signal transduction histidine kinase
MQLTPYYEEFQKPLAAIDGQVNKVVSLVNRLLDVSRVQMGRLEMKPELVDLGELARRQANRAQIKATEHKIVVDSDSEVVGYWDPGYIEQVVTNLVDNAVRYSPSGSEVRISLRQVNNTALLTVTDQGIGISSDALPNLFQRYYRSEEAKRICAEGMGIGLYVTYSIVNAHGGCIWVDSEPGKGSTFHVQLPVQPASFWKEAEESIYAKQQSEEQHTGG